jgi:hypothetical protein
VHRVLTDEEHEHALAFAAFEPPDGLPEIVGTQPDEDLVTDLGTAEPGETPAHRC